MKTDDITAHDDAVVKSFRLYDDDADPAISRDEYQVFLQSIKVRNYQGIQGNMQNGFGAERWADALKKLGVPEGEHTLKLEYWTTMYVKAFHRVNLFKSDLKSAATSHLWSSHSSLNSSELKRRLVSANLTCEEMEDMIAALKAAWHQRASAVADALRSLNTEEDTARQEAAAALNAEIATLASEETAGNRIDRQAGMPAYSKSYTARALKSLCEKQHLCRDCTEKSA